jgi:FAD/FMN-containing dehydrogenase
VAAAIDRARHDERTRLLASALRHGAGSVALGKDTSNLFRDRASAGKRRLDVRAFCDVLDVDPGRGVAEVEGMVPYAALVDATLAQGVMPAVVPQLKSITIGGAAAGIGIEASSFRYGLVHETLLEIEVLTGRGDVVRCTPENEHRDLYFGFPNSYGTLGYALSVRAATVPVKPFVRITHRRFSSAAAFFEQLAAACAQQQGDFVDGVVFGPDEMRLTVGAFVEEAPYTSDYTYRNVYYRSLRERTEDYLTTRDFIWRWDTDWFWCSKNVGAQNPLLRRLLGRDRLNSVTYTRIMRWNSRLGLTRKVERALGWHSESVIQDVDIPLARAPEFLEFFLREIGILPVWICPVRTHDASRNYPLYPLQGDTLYVNFGFWDVVRRRQGFEPGHHNRLIESKVEELGGIKSLYSESYFDRDTFRRIYGGAAYDALKRQYDPGGRFPDLYDKVVLRR